MKIGWVDFSDDERQRASQVLEMARNKGAVDELGLGVLRDGFSYKFFPGTSTLHTHARYYFLTAYLMKDLARKFSGTGRESVYREYQRREKATAQALVNWCVANGRGDEGIVGKSFLNGQEWTKQTPAMMNWAAMAEYGILKDAGTSLSSFLNMVAASSDLSSGADAEGDIDYISLSPADAVWNVSNEGYADWLDDQVSVDLLPCEARMLFDSICNKFPDSLYAHLLMNPESISKLNGMTSFIELTDNASYLVPGFEDAPLLELGADFSSLAAMLHIRFNYLVRHYDTERYDEESEREWENCFADGSSYKGRALECDIDRAFAAIGAISASGRNYQTNRFLKVAQAAIAEKDLTALDEAIRKRELRLKGHSRSKIANGEAYCGEWYGGTEFTFRLSTACGLANEIVNPLEGGLHAELGR